METLKLMLNCQKAHKRGKISHGPGIENDIPRLTLS